LINIILEIQATSFTDFRLGLSATRLDLLLSLVFKSGSSKSDNNKLLVYHVARPVEKLYPTYCVTYQIDLYISESSKSMTGIMMLIQHEVIHFPQLSHRVN